jgi:hypothetical protein
MLASIKSHVMYWGFLLVKLAGAALGSASAMWFLNLFWLPATPWFQMNTEQFCYNLPYTTLAGVWFLFSYGLFYLVFWDQKYRCRTCLRKLRMPVETGSWGYILQLGRPRIEYICSYGHGKLNVEELQYTGKVGPEWTEHGDMWAELYASGNDPEEKR